MTWEFNIPFQSRAQTVREALEAGVDQSLEGEDREVAFQLLLIGFMATESRGRKGGGRDLLVIDLLEVSVVSKPMHPATRALSWKTAERHGRARASSTRWSPGVASTTSSSESSSVSDSTRAGGTGSWRR